MSIVRYFALGGAEHHYVDVLPQLGMLAWTKRLGWW
jgi:hypothetical protein